MICCKKYVVRALLSEAGHRTLVLSLIYRSGLWRSRVREIGHSIVFTNVWSSRISSTRRPLSNGMLNVYVDVAGSFRSDVCGATEWVLVCKGIGHKCTHSLDIGKSGKLLSLSALKFVVYALYPGSWCSIAGVPGWHRNAKVS
jgi:hypothetical protein